MVNVDNVPMRVLHVLGNTEAGGAQALIMNIYRRIDRTKIQFDFMVHTADKGAYDDEIIASGGRIYRIMPYRVINHMKYKNEWREFFKSNNKNNDYAFVQGHMTSTASIYFKIAKKNKIKTIAHAHNTSSGKGLSAIIKNILQLPLKYSADYLFACSTAAAKWCFGTAGGFMDKVVRILHSVGSMDRGGQETLIMNVYRNIDRQKLQFDFLINNPRKCDYEDEINSMGGIIHRIPRRFPNYIKHLSCLDDFFRNNKQYNTIHQHTGINLAVSTIIGAKKHKLKKIIYHSHCSNSEKGVIASIFDLIYTPKIKDYATHYFTCSDSSATHLFGNYIDKAKITLIKNGINTEHFVFDDSLRKQKKAELKIGNRFAVGHIGRFATAKNHTFLIDIFAEIQKKIEDAVLLLIGEGELRGDIEKKIETLGLKDNVILTGVRSDISGLLCAMDVFLFPSLWEGLPVVLVEAQANGLHCIVSDTTTEEAKITDLIEYVSLDEKPSHWADKAVSFAKGYERRNTQDEITRAGFDIKEVAKSLEKFYLEETGS